MSRSDEAGLVSFGTDDPSRPYFLACSSLSVCQNDCLSLASLLSNLEAMGGLARESIGLNLCQRPLSKSFGLFDVVENGEKPRVP
jgi:hypothetical protein